ncbi:NAC domain containing protein 2 [Euphorbia peplus]|nr:NAC domain containing protein 2 [Euphorbia peplus]
MDDSNNDDTLPTGYRFVPTDEELVLHYLNLNLNGGSLPPLIGEFNLYDKNPWEILEKSYTGIFHVVTQIHYLSRQKVGRRAGSGTWKGENTKNICDEDGHVL